MAELNSKIKANLKITNIKELEDLIKKLNEDIEKLKNFQPNVEINFKEE